MITIKKLAIIDSPEILEEKLTSYVNELKKFNNCEDFSEVNTIGEKLNLLQENAFDVSEKETFLIMNQEDIDFIEDLFNKIELNFILEDLSKKYFHNDLEIFNIIPDKERLEEAFLNSLTIDNVLDKINASGIESLNEIDKMILENGF